MKKGFTLLELLIVIIVIGILATIAIPQYLKTIERGYEGKAKHSMALLAQGEKMYRTENDAYTAFGNGDAHSALSDFISLADVDADADWEYEVTADVNTFLVTATRTAGPNVDETITLTESGTWTDDFTP